MRKHTDTIVTSAFLALCVLGALFYTFHGGESFGKSIVALGGLGWLLATLGFLVFLLREKKTPASVCAGVICLLQLLILFFWVSWNRSFYIIQFGHQFTMPWWLGTAIHLLILILGILVFRRVRKIH